MFIQSQKAEEQAVMNLAHAICAAARTAPKARGTDHMDTAILTGDDKAQIVEEMRRIGAGLGAYIPGKFNDEKPKEQGKHA